MFTQTITPNPNISCRPGWCLEYVRRTYGLPAMHPTATAAWNASTKKHRDYNFPSGVWIPLWFSLHKEPAGHVALLAPDGSVYSTSDLGNIPHKHPSLNNLIWFYNYYGMPLTYLGWTEDVQNYTVVSPAITVQGKATQLEDDDMFTDKDRDNLVMALDKANRAAEVAQAQEDRGDSAKINLIFQALNQIAPQFRFFKGPESDTLYELEDGKLRGITLAEWQARGGIEPLPLKQSDIESLTQGPKA